MYLNEHYMMYRIAFQLVHAEDFELLHRSESGDELWLEKYKKRTSRVIRLYHRGYDWRDDLQKDISLVFRKAKAMKNLFLGKHIEIHNVYIASHAPVDEWETLKRPLQLNEKTPMNMTVYYLSEADKHKELERLQEAFDIDIQGLNQVEEMPEADKEAYTQYYQSRLACSQKRKEQEMKSIFSFGKPFLTYGLLVVNILMFLLIELAGSSTSTETLIEFGAKYNPGIIEDGEWWRIISSMFLHIGAIHLLMNMLAVYYLGSIVERIYGSIRFLFIYFLAGIGGGIASFAFTANVSAGASGALFGLFGALLFFGSIHKKIFFQTMGTNVLIVIGINIIFGMAVPQVDNGAHLGGLMAGFIASAILHLPGKKNIAIQLSAVMIYLLIIFGVISYGLDSNNGNPAYQLIKTEHLLAEKAFEEASETAGKGLQLPSETLDDDLETQLLFQRSYAYIQLSRDNEAVTDLEKSVEINNDFAEAHHNLAILYADKAKNAEASEHIERAYELQPDNSDIQKLYERITGKTTE